MDSILDIHDLIHTGELVVAVAILWTQQKAIQRWAERHEARDDERFDQHQKRLDTLSDKLIGVKKS